MLLLNNIHAIIMWYMLLNNINILHICSY
jgi:hypothetical protein